MLGHGTNSFCRKGKMTSSTDWKCVLRRFARRPTPKPRTYYRLVQMPNSHLAGMLWPLSRSKSAWKRSSETRRGQSELWRGVFAPWVSDRMPSNGIGVPLNFQGSIPVYFHSSFALLYNNREHL